MLDTLISSIPLVLLIWLMVKKKSVPSHIALPITALVMYLFSLTLLQMDVVLAHAKVLEGFLTSWTPILIIWGAILLFRTMEATGAMDTIRTWLNNISSNRVAQLMIVGWAFPFLIEGASGFGTPAAIAAPLLVGLGFPAMKVAILTLMMNSVPVSFGAVGTPTWFGFSAIGNLSTQEIAAIGLKSAVINSTAALVIPFIALSIVVKPSEIRANARFVVLSILSTVLPYTAVAAFNYEFPSIVGGFCGVVTTALLARHGIGLKAGNSVAQGRSPVSGAALLKAAFPLWGTLVVLIVTRIPALGLKQLLNATSPSLEIPLGFVGTFTISPALVIGLQKIFETGAFWSHQLLFVPSIIPFLMISMITFRLFGSESPPIKQVFKETNRAMRNPALALFAALIFVKLMMTGGERAPVALMGTFLSELAGSSWQFFAAYLGALGSFFSGSNTISNLTFAPIQDTIATNLGLNRTTILALQSVGGAMGNMVCINNIVAVCSILMLDKSEGLILKRTAVAMVIYGVIAGLVSFVLGVF
jgi:lactate permease